MTNRINKPNISQELRVLEVLQKNKGQWVNGKFFSQTMMITQYHRAIFNLQNRRDLYKYDGEIESSSTRRDDYGFCYYRLKSSSVQGSLFKEETQKEKLDKLMCLGI